MSTSRFTRQARAVRLRMPGLILALMPLWMAGCTIHIHNSHVSTSDPANPLVLVKDGRVSVNAEPLYFSKSDGAVTITWRLPAGSNLAFADNGIVVESADREPKPPGFVLEEFQCKRGALPNEFSCLNRNSQPGRYKYTVRVSDGGKALPPLDPMVINDW